MAGHDRGADVDGAPPSGGKPSTDALMAENCDEADVDGAPPGGGKPSTDALLSAESARLPLALALLQVTGDVPLRWHTAGDLDACAGERAPHNWSIMLPVSQRVQPGVYTLMALSRYRDALVQRVGSERPLVYQPLVPHILTACYQVVLLPPRDFGEWPPVARDVYYAVALFLQVRAVHPDLIQKHRGAGSLLLTPRLDTQATFAKLFADIGVDGDIRYARVEELLKHGPPAPASITARHVQALRADLRAETLSHAAGLTSHTTLLVFGKSGFIGQDEAGHGRSTVGLTRARGTTILLDPPDPYGLTGLVQTTYAYYFTVHKLCSSACHPQGCGGSAVQWQLHLRTRCGHDSRVTGSRASRGKRPTCGTSLLLHKQVPPAQATRRIHLAPSGPIAVLPLLALLCLFPLTLPLPGQLRVLSPVYRYLRPGSLEIPLLVGIRLMSWLVARFLMLLWLHLVM